jgi:3-methyladenine DNA glycosylase Mpg
MFGPAGHLYVYFTYGMHWCANAVCGDDGEGVAVLLRALAPLDGLDAMRAARPRARRDRDLCSGPAKLCQALGITRSDDGADLVTGDRGLVVVDDGTPAPANPVQTTRIGLSAGSEHPWRWFVAGDPNVSTPAGAVRATRASRASQPSPVSPAVPSRANRDAGAAPNRPALSTSLAPASPGRIPGA